MREEKNRLHRALHNFSVRKDYKHEVVFPEAKRLQYNDAYSWSIEKFGEPGETWDFYIIKEYRSVIVDRYNFHHQRELWLDTFGFINSEDATMFILRWC
jgi:hypothetical protein